MLQNYYPPWDEDPPGLKNIGLVLVVVLARFPKHDRQPADRPTENTAGSMAKEDVWLGTHGLLLSTRDHRVCSVTTRGKPGG
ncbi:hypothetical protein L195_g033211 [Trifolium pratense]|uniref:Uncharacterized protein n=1 Tax=Trifolium pratense TaxID=57577 RepID=A0A2K3LFE0_TRIPR|nr:hypothetical protein L195_g033211 [Trifolium pratense]